MTIYPYPSLLNEIVTVASNNPIFIPRKHTIDTYRDQQRRAKKRRKAKQK